ncbi:MAG: M23 family metallopeptidase [Methylococcales bacterium]
MNTRQGGKQPRRHSPSYSIWSILRKALFGLCAIFLFLIIVLYLGLIFDQDPMIPVRGAAPKDWNPKTFWYEPWGTSKVHKGIDIFARKGTEALAAVSGVVVHRADLKFGGNSLTILGPRWRIHYYAHLDSVAAKIEVGDWVPQGSIIGTVGNSGNARGRPAHLHYAVMSLIPCPNRYSTRMQGWKLMFYLNPDPYLRLNMKLAKHDDSNSKTLQDHYARISGVDFSGQGEKLTDPSLSEQRNQSQWYLLLLAPLAVALGTWLLFQLLPENTPNPDPPPAHYQRLPGPESPTEPKVVDASQTDKADSGDSDHGEVEQAVSESRPSEQAVSEVPPSNQEALTEPGVSDQATATDADKQAVTDQNAQKSESLVKPQSDDIRVQPDNRKFNPPQTLEANHKPTPSGDFFVVLLSTKSKNNAVGRAQEFSGKGYPSEVVLSSTGYYGVVLRRNTSREAKDSMAAIVASGVSNTKPYVMSSKRVKQHIYP